MKKEWCVIQIQVKGEFVEVVSALLAAHGSQGTLIEERALDCFQAPNDDLEPAAEYCLQAYFDRQDPSALLGELRQAAETFPVLRDAAAAFAVGPPIELSNWAENWKQHFPAFLVGKRLVIRPSWDDAPLDPGLAGVEIDPGMAFGTGTHATTRLCLEVLSELLDGPNPPQDMLDVGTGSGILALAGAALGCPTVLATDIDDVACRVARENVERNRLEAQIRVTAEPLEKLPGRFGLLVANILAEENVRLKEQFREHLRPGGWLVLSGILRERSDFVAAAFSSPEWQAFPPRLADDWACLIYRRAE